MAKHSSEM
uniref:Uncharacterized protein n=1 Tax=Anguilla anguilla TaxID=7936 RepID=A0A0E9R264_ANGAN